MLEWESLSELEKLKAKELFNQLDTIYASYQGEMNMRRFNLERREDESGISGTGIVVEGVMFSDGSVALRWLTNTTSWGIYRSMSEVEAIHGHNGKTLVRWLDTKDEVS